MTHARTETETPNATAPGGNTFSSHAAAPQLRPYIRAYRFFDLDGSVPYTVPAWTRTMMLFRYGDFFYAYFPDGRTLPHLGGSFFGSTTRPLAYGGVTGRYCFVAVEFQPLAMQALVRERGDSFTDEVVDAGAVYGDLPIRLVVEQLSAARSTADRCAVLDRFFEPRLTGRECPIDPALQELLAQVRVARGPLSIGRLMQASGLTERTLRRRFTTATGLAPQLYQSILRAERALAMLYSAPWAKPADIVGACGFTDQAHLVHELRRFALATPGELRRTRDAGPGPLQDFFHLDAV